MQEEDRLERLDALSDLPAGLANGWNNFTETCG